MLTQGKDDNEAGRKKDKQDTVNTIAREYKLPDHRLAEVWLVASEDTLDMKHMVLIAGRNQKDRLLTALSESGGPLLNFHYGRGSVKASFLMDTYGLVPEENKIIITCMVTDKEADAIFNMLEKDFHFDKPNTGIAFTIPVKKLSF